MREQPALVAGPMARARRLAGALMLVAAVCAFAATGVLARGRRHHRHHARHHHARVRRHRGVPGNGTQPSHGPNAHGQLLHLAPGRSLNTNQSNNWSGYNQGSLEQGGTPPKQFNSIGGSWTVPTVTQHTSGQAEYSSDWIGIGGGCIDAGCTVTDSTLIQTGTEQDVDSSGNPSYSVWWEVIPGPSLTITSMAVHPGDRITASIGEVVPGSELWTISIADTTDGQSYTTTLPYTSTHATAEWIQETPLLLDPSNPGFASEPNLSSPAFDLATTDGAPANLKASEEMNLVDSNGNVIGAPSGPDPDTDGFNVCTWAGTCTAPSSS